MQKILKLILTNKINSMENISYLLNTVSNIKERISNATYHLSNLIDIKNKISNPITVFMTDKELQAIDLLAAEFFARDFNEKVFLQIDFSNKLQQLWNILDDIYVHDPYDIVVCVTRIIDKRIPQGITESEKAKFTDDILVKFIRTSKKVNTVTDFIFDHIKDDRQNHRLDVLSICGILLSFVINSQSHLYFVMENIKKANELLKKKYDIDEIFSLESKVRQNTQDVTDIQAIRNAISHGSFNLEYNSIQKEYIIEFQSVISGYSFNKKYTGSQLFILYGIYDNLRNFQELLIRMAFLKATLRLFFFKAQ
jgi:hypothetical protein